METRAKIVALDAACALLGSKAWVVVEGLFDPLTATQAKRLAGFSREGRRLLVVIRPGDDPLLNADARAALVAALRSVDAVTIASFARHIMTSISPHNSQIEWIEDNGADAARSAEFINFVLDRQRTVASS